MSDARIIALIAAGHMVSHFLQLTIPPLFPLLKSEFDVSWVALGLVSSVFYGVSGVMQTVSGFFVDRLGARRVLLAGMTLFAGAIAAAGFASSYWMLLPVAAVAGVGNSVFHPADYSMLNGSVSARRIARGYSAHAILGSVGFILGPVFVGSVSHFAGWRTALVAAGIVGCLATLVLARETRGLGQPTPRIPHAPRVGLRADIRVLISAPILMALGYFALLSASSTGIQTFSVPALGMIYLAPLTLATGALTVYLVGSALGTFTGGFLAERVTRHDLVAAGGVLSAATLMAVLATGSVPLALIGAVMAAAGFSMGITGPSRDMLVRAATPRGSSGKVFGFVYSGMDLGSLIAPPMYGWFLDRGEPRAMFAAVGAIMLVMIFTVVQVRRRVAPTPQPAPGG
jgi:MFS family permease